MNRTLPILVAIALITAACGGGSGGGDTTADTGAAGPPTTAAAPATAAADPPSSAGGLSAIDELPELTYELASTGDLAFEHEGTPACQLAGGTELVIDFVPTNATAMFNYQLRAADYDPASANYGIAFTIETEAGTSQGSGWMTVTTAEGPDLVRILTGEFTAAVSGAAGESGLEGRFTCTV